MRQLGRDGAGGAAFRGAMVVVLLLGGGHALAQPLAPSPDAPRDTEETEPTVLDTGAEGGYARLDSANYFAPTLAADLRLYALQASLRAPLRFDMSTWELREADWDETGDFLRVGQCVRLDFSEQGRFEREHGLCQPWDVHRDDYYFSFRMGPIQGYDLGHGTILRAYSNNLNPDHYQAGVIGDLQFHQFVHGEFLVDNVVRPEIVGGTLALRPIAYEVDETPHLYAYRHNIEAQVSAVSDLGAPTEVLTAFGEALTDGAGNLLYRQAPVTVLGADARYRFVFGQQVEFEARLDWNWIAGEGMGGHLQAWGIYNHPDGVYSVRGIGEVRYQEEDYIPSYFDSYYYIQRQQYGLTEGAIEQVDRVRPEDGEFTTKQEYLEALPEDTWHAGYLGGLELEVFAGSGDERRTALKGRLFLSDTLGRDGDGQFLVSLEVPRLSDDVDVYALYSRQNFDEILDVFQLDDTLVKVLVRWDLDESFYLLMNYGRIWQLETDQEGRSAEGFSSNNEFGISLGFSEEALASGGAG